MKRFGMMALVAALSVMTGCGLSKVAEETRDQVKESNKTQQDLLDQIKKTEAETERVRKLTQDLVTGMNRTNQGVHLQILTQSLSGLMSKDNTDLLTPPLRMMPFAQAFTKEATPDEIMGVFHTLISEVLLGFDKAEKGDKRVGSRMIALTAASAIAAFATEAKAEAILKAQIDTKGQFEASAYLFGLSRYNFIRDYFFGAILSSSTVNIDSLRAVVGYYSAMKFLATRPYAAKMQINAESLVVVDSTKGTYSNLVDQLDPTKTAGLARSAVRRFQAANGLGADVINSKEAQDLLAKLK